MFGPIIAYQTPNYMRTVSTYFIGLYALKTSCMSHQFPPPPHLPSC